MGAKTFYNQTGHDLKIVLTVRLGSDPGTAADVQAFSLGNAQQTFFTYSGDDNPYLDGILVNATDDPNFNGEIYVFTRGDANDNSMNTNNTVTLSAQGETPVFSFSNQ